MEKSIIDLMPNGEKYQMRRICFTGHRDIKAEDITYVKSCLRLLIRQEIRNGATNFMSGLAKGVDTYAAQIVYDEKKNFPHIVLEGAAPYRGRLNSKDPETRAIIGVCDKIFVVSEKYAKGCFQKRNEFMVDNSDKVIAVYDKRKKGGTRNTIKYAEKSGKDIFVLDLDFKDKDKEAAFVYYIEKALELDNKKNEQN